MSEQYHVAHVVTQAFIDTCYSLLWLRTQEDAASNRGNVPQWMWTSAYFWAIYQFIPCPFIIVHTTLLDFHIHSMYASEKQSICLGISSKS